MGNALTSIRNLFSESFRTQNGQRKVLILIAGMLFLLVAVKMGWNTYHSYNQALNQQIEIKSMEYQRLARIVSKGEQFRKLNESLNEFKQKLINKSFIQAATPALAEVKFQNMVNQMAEENAIRILSLRMLPRKDTQDFSIIKMGINCRAEIGSIKDFLKHIHDNALFIFFNEMEVKRINRREKKYFNFNAQLAAWANI